MFRTFFFSIGLIHLLLLSIAPEKARAADFNAFAGAAIGRNSFSQSGPTSALGWGSQVTVGLGDLLGAELGVIYQGEASIYGTAGSGSSLTQNFLDVPLMLRVSLIPHLSFMGGAYYGWGVGPNRYYATDGSITSGSGSNKHDYGQIFGASLQLPFQKHMKLRLESTYLHGNANISTGPYTEYTRVLTFWIGGQFDFDWKFFRPTVKR
jgi:hypothetical protein